MSSAGLLRAADLHRLWAGSSSAARRGSLSAFDICVVSGNVHHFKVHRLPGQQWLARVNPVAVGDDLSLMTRAQQAGIAIIAGTLDGQRPMLDVSAPAWPEFAVSEMLLPLLARGFDGWVLEGLDGNEGAARLLLSQVHQKCAGAQVVIKNGFDLAQRHEGAGVLIEGAAEELVVHEPRVRESVAAKRRVLAIAHGSSASATDLANRLQSWGALPFVTPPGETGLSLAPLREQSRRVLVLYGRDPKETDKPRVLPIDTMTAELFQTPLEWLGYEADYLDVSSQPLPADGAAFAAVIFDAEMDIPIALEPRVTSWIGNLKSAGVPILFAGDLPFERDDSLEAIRQILGLRGTLAGMPKVKDVAIANQDPTLVSAEVKAAPRIQEFRDLQAPEGARVLLSLTGRGPLDEPLRSTPVFWADWGGMWLEPYVILRASQDSYLFYADPYKMMAALLEKRGTMPAPDTTTRDGARIFYSHIDGDGFVSRSDFKGHPFCAELVRDRILKRFAFPVTVSIIEADIRAWSEGVEDKDQPEIEALAKSIFALPNVRAASHSFSHPYQWDAGDPNPGIYTEPNLNLKPAANYPKIGTSREIAGSVQYINDHLLPPDKRVELFLWSGNCRPGEEALRQVRALGLENMNGGNTIISRLYPGIAGIAPRVIQWGEELQINAANQNEFMYANGWNGPFYGGFAEVIDTFERTELPRRIKPVNVYYHFYSATSLSALRALEKIYSWCEEQALHPISAVDFARLTRDAHRTRIFNLGARRWLLSNDGQSRTYRLPKEMGRPDMAKSQGVTGWSLHADSLYVHTNGQTRTELVLSDSAVEPPQPKEAHLFLSAVNAPIAFSELNAWKASFYADSLRPVTAEFGGLPARSTCSVSINGQVTALSTDDRGRLSLQLPAKAQVILDANRSRYASLLR